MQSFNRLGFAGRASLLRCNAALYNAIVPEEPPASKARAKWQLVDDVDGNLLLQQQPVNAPAEP